MEYSHSRPYSRSSPFAASPAPMGYDFNATSRDYDSPFSPLASMSVALGFDGVLADMDAGTDTDWDQEFAWQQQQRAEEMQEPASYHQQDVPSRFVSPMPPMKSYDAGPSPPHQHQYQYQYQRPQSAYSPFTDTDHSSPSAHSHATAVSQTPSPVLAAGGSPAAAAVGALTGRKRKPAATTTRPKRPNTKNIRDRTPSLTPVSANDDGTTDSAHPPNTNDHATAACETSGSAKGSGNSKATPAGALASPLTDDQSLDDTISRFYCSAGTKHLLLIDVYLVTLARIWKAFDAKPSNINVIAADVTFLIAHMLDILPEDSFRQCLTSLDYREYTAVEFGKLHPTLTLDPSCKYHASSHRCLPYVSLPRVSSRYAVYWSQSSTVCTDEDPEKPSFAQLSWYRPRSMIFYRRVCNPSRVIALDTETQSLPAGAVAMSIDEVDINNLQVPMYVQVNAAFERLFGYSQVEIKSRFVCEGKFSLMRMIDAEQLQAIIARDSKRLLSGSVEMSHAIDIVHRNGQRARALMHHRARHNEQGCVNAHHWCWIPLPVPAKA